MNDSGRDDIDSELISEPKVVYIQITNMYAPAWGYGGPARLLFEYACWLSSRADVAVFTSNIHHDFRTVLSKGESISNVSVFRYRLIFPTLAKKSIYLISASMCLAVARLIRNSQGPAIIHFSEFRGVVPLYAMILKACFGKRVVLVHSAFGSLHEKPGRRRKIYDALFLKHFVRLVDVCLAQNSHEHECYCEIFRQSGIDDTAKISLLPLHINELPCEGQRFSQLRKNQVEVGKIRRKHSIAEDALVFIFLGRIHPEKGILRMMATFGEFSRSWAGEIMLLIVGRDDGFHQEVQEFISGNGLGDKVRIVNNVYEERFDYYFMADIFLGFPTIFEESMLASIEAMACGTPIVVSREADIPFVQEERAGLVIDFEIRTAVRAMEEVASQLVAFQMNARRTAFRFEGTHVRPAFLQLLQEAVSRGPGIATGISLERAAVGTGGEKCK